VTEYRDMTAEQMAIALVEAADAVERGCVPPHDPTPMLRAAAALLGGTDAEEETKRGPLMTTLRQDEIVFHLGWLNWLEGYYSGVSKEAAPQGVANALAYFSRAAGILR
jgi:hypothetical protein